jgi:hypothetical protein
MLNRWRPRPTASRTSRHNLPWYAACILMPAALGWTPQQILVIAPVIIVIVVLAPVPVMATRR